MTDPVGNPPPSAALDPEAPAGWAAALAALVSTRLDLIRLEGVEVAGDVVKRLVCLAAAAVLALFLWALVLAGGIGALAAATGWGWHWLALGAAAGHLLVIVILLGVARKRMPTAFPITRAEFERDRAWLERLKQQNARN